MAVHSGPVDAEAEIALLDQSDQEKETNKGGSRKIEQQGRIKSQKVATMRGTGRRMNQQQGGYAQTVVTPAPHDA